MDIFWFMLLSPRFFGRIFYKVNILLAKYFTKAYNFMRKPNAIYQPPAHPHA